MSDIRILVSVPLFANAGLGVLLVALAFLVGSIPFGVVVGRLFYRSDLRQSGSGNIGAANALRTYGKAGGAIVLLLDAAKGFAVTAIAHMGPWQTLTGLGLAFEIATNIDLGGAATLGLAAVFGHCFSPWLRFRGGKGVATWLGVLFALSWLAGVLFIAIWLLVVLPTRHASLGSLIATIASPLSLWFLTNDVTATACAAIAAALIVWKHRENIVRLREGRENKISFGKTAG